MMLRCHTETCAEWNGTDPPRPSPAAYWVAQATTADDVRLVAVCEGHAEGWYDGCDEWLPHVRVPVHPNAGRATAAAIAERFAEREALRREERQAAMLDAGPILAEYRRSKGD